MASESNLGQSILITGAAGFIGSAVTNYFVKTYPNKKIYGLDKISYCSNLKNLDESNHKENFKNFKFIPGDICEIDYMKFIFNEFQIDTILHFAAYSHVDHSFGNSLIFTKNNVIGTHTLLEVAKLNRERIRLFVHVSTDEVYGDNESTSNEKSLMKPTNPYSASKGAAECLVWGYHHSFGIPCIITRGNNVYGPFQYPEKAIPRFCMRLLQGKQCEIQGDGKQTRSFLFIDDVVAAFDLIASKGKNGEVYNIGSSEEISISHVADTLIKLIYGEAVHSEAGPKVHGTNNTAKEYVNYVKDRDFNDKRYLISCDKLHALGWEQKISFEEGIKLTLDWYRSNLNYWSEFDLSHALEHTNRQIQ